HGGASDLPERADMRQARRAVAGFKDHLIFGMLLETRDDLAGFLEWPSVRLLRKCAQARCISGIGGDRHSTLRLDFFTIFRADLVPMKPNDCPPAQAGTHYPAAPLGLFDRPVNPRIKSGEGKDI